MDVFIARQPIFNRHKKVFGYELLYRVGLDNRFDNSDGDKATSQVITNSLTVLGLNTITHGKKAFINFTKRLIQDEISTTLPPEQVVIEVLENISLDIDFLEACKKLKNLGYVLALDDFVFHPQYQPLIQIADIIKVDFLNSEPPYRATIIQKIKQPQLKFLAEKVETKADFKQALELGYSYFQGYFFCKPDIIAAKDLPAYKMTYLRVLQQVNQPDLDFTKLEQIIMQDVSLSYKLLRYINSAAFGFTSRINSIRNALVILGILEIKKWVSLLAMKGMGEDKPEELAVDSIIRARFCELLAPTLGLAERSYDLFLMGLFSLIDTFIGRPKEEIFTDLPIAPEIKEALLGKENSFYEGYHLCLSYRDGNWGQVNYYLNKFNIPVAKISALFLDSLKWADQIFN